MVGRERRRVTRGGRAPGAYRRRRACRVPRSLRLWPGGGGRKARRGVVAIVSLGWLATPERPSIAVLGTIIQPAKRFYIFHLLCCLTLSFYVLCVFLIATACKLQLQIDKFCHSGRKIPLLWLVRGQNEVLNSLFQKETSG